LPCGASGACYAARRCQIAAELGALDLIELLNLAPSFIADGS